MRWCAQQSFRRDRSLGTCDYDSFTIYQLESLWRLYAYAGSRRVEQATRSHNLLMRICDLTFISQRGYDSTQCVSTCLLLASLLAFSIEGNTTTIMERLFDCVEGLVLGVYVPMQCTLSNIVGFYGRRPKESPPPPGQQPGASGAAGTSRE